MTNAVLGYDNRFDAAALTGSGSAIASLPVANLQDKQPRKYYGTTGGSTFWIADFGAAGAPIDVVATIRSNLTAAATTQVRVSSADPTGVAGDVYNSGSIAAGADPRFYGGVLHILPARATGRYLRVDYADAAAFLDAAGTIAGIDLGRVFAGPLFKPSRNFRFGGGLGFMDLGTKKQSVGGQIHTKKGAKPRVLALAWQYMTEADFYAGALEIDRTVGATDDLLVVRNPAAIANVAAGWLWGVPSDLQLPTEAALRLWQKSYTVTERL
jgi:hypothetical protein